MCVCLFRIDHTVVGYVYTTSEAPWPFQTSGTSRRSDDQLNWNITEAYIKLNQHASKRRTPSEIYWQYEVLGMSSGIDEGSSEFKWDLVLCLLLSWVIVFLCLIKSIKSSGKVVYFTALFPYAVLGVLFIWNVQLEGAWLGIKFYIIPNWHKLKSAKVWYAAGAQIFYSLGIAFGTIETMASYNKFKNNVHRDAVLVAVINCGTRVFSGFVIFSVIGAMAAKTGLPVDEVAAGGPGLAFVAYPEGIAMMPVAPLWSVLFFSMLFTLGIDSQFTKVECICTAFADEFPWLKIGKRRIVFLFIVCSTMFLLGLPQCTKAGIYIMNLFDWYSAGFNVIVIAFVEVLAISWIYGVNRFSEDIEMMIGHRPNCYWIACWTVLAPLVMTFIFAFAVINYSKLSYGSYVYPTWADGLGWLMVAGSLSTIPIGVTLHTYKACAAKEPKILFTSSPDWGPALPEFRTGRYDHLLMKDVTRSSVQDQGFGSSPIDGHDPRSIISGDCSDNQKSTFLEDSNSDGVIRSVTKL